MAILGTLFALGGGVVRVVALAARLGGFGGPLLGHGTVRRVLGTAGPCPLWLFLVEAPTFALARILTVGKRKGIGKAQIGGRIFQNGMGMQSPSGKSSRRSLDRNGHAPQEPGKDPGHGHGVLEFHSENVSFSVPPKTTTTRMIVVVAVVSPAAVFSRGALCLVLVVIVIVVAAAQIRLLFQAMGESHTHSLLFLWRTCERYGAPVDPL